MTSSTTTTTKASNVLLVLFAIASVTVAYNDGFYNIAHMCNNVETVEWAMSQGANAIEADLQFDADGNPFEFRHSKWCDCTCMCHFGLTCKLFWSKSVCTPLASYGQPCKARTDTAAVLKRAAEFSRELALVWIDSKMTNLPDNKMKVAASNVVKMVEDNLFKRGYEGVVMFSAVGSESVDYLREISRTKSPFRERIHFTMDSVSMEKTKELLDFPWNRNVIFNTGSSGCSPKSIGFKKAKLIAVNVAKGVFGAGFAWTLNKGKSMDDYIHYFNGMITNFPSRLASSAKKYGIKLAKPSARIPAAVGNADVHTDASKYRCSCDYKWWNGGCVVNKPAPADLACYCSRTAFFCKGWVVKCTDQSSGSCHQPGTSHSDCRQGRGNCGGY